MWCLRVVSMRVSLVTTEGEHPCMHLRVGHLCVFLGEGSIQSPFELECLSFCCLAVKSALDILDTRLIGYRTYKYFLPFCCCLFHYNVLRSTKVLTLMKSNFSFVAPTFGVISKNPSPNPRA